MSNAPAPGGKRFRYLAMLCATLWLASASELRLHLQAFGAFGSYMSGVLPSFFSSASIACWFLSLDRDRVRLAIGRAALLSITFEFSQLFLPSHRFDPNDLAFCLSGCAFVYLLAVMVRS